MTPDSQKPQANEFRARKRLALTGGGWVVATVALLVLIYQIVVCFCLPTRFLASATIAFNLSQAGGPEARDAIYAKPSFICSTNILYPVSEQLDLAAKWGHKFGGGDYVLKQVDVYNILLGRVTVHCPNNVIGPVSVDALSDNRQEAIDVANAIAVSCRDYFWKKDSSQSILVTDAVKATGLPGNVKSWIFPWCLSVLFVVLGIVMIIWGRKSPRPVLAPEIPEASLVSKY